jgi:hypothetical protein
LLIEPADDLECRSMCAVTPVSFSWSQAVGSKTVSWFAKRVVTEFQCTWTRAAQLC